MEGETDDHDWSKARKIPKAVRYRGPYTTPDEIETLEGDFEVDEDYIEEHGGYVIIRGVRGEEYPCALDIFVETYTPAPDGKADPVHTRKSGENSPFYRTRESTNSLLAKEAGMAVSETVNTTDADRADELILKLNFNSSRIEPQLEYAEVEVYSQRDVYLGTASTDDFDFDI